MAKLDAWANPASVSADVPQMAAFLEARSAMADQRQVNETLLQALGALPGERWLEVGSGSGVLSRLLGKRLGPRGHVTGVDLSLDFVREAERYLAEDPAVAGIVSFRQGSADALPFDAGGFDGAFAARLLLHLEDPVPAVREMMRVVKPGGVVALLDWDFESLLVDHPDRALTRRILLWRVDHHGGNNWSGRELWRHARAAGLTNIEVTPVTVVATDEQTGLTQSLFRAAEVAQAGGAISEAERAAWLEEITSRLAAGQFFASLSYFIVRGQSG
jgi:ubiquinone/menaquinone biosynthesis C-methylase UbiE